MFFEKHLSHKCDIFSVAYVCLFLLFLFSRKEKQNLFCGKRHKKAKSESKQIVKNKNTNVKCRSKNNVTPKRKKEMHSMEAIAIEAEWEPQIWNCRITRVRLHSHSDCVSWYRWTDYLLTGWIACHCKNGTQIHEYNSAGHREAAVRLDLLLSIF